MTVDSAHYLDEIVKAQKRGEPRGITSDLLGASDGTGGRISTCPKARDSGADRINLQSGQSIWRLHRHDSRSIL